MRTTPIAIALLVLSGALSGCLPTDPPEGVLACTTAAECPDGWACASSRCWRTGPGDGGAQPDGGMADADVEGDGGRVDGGLDDGGPIDASPPDGGSGCAGDFVCATAAPGGWNGPVVLVSGAGDVAAPTCPTYAPATAFATHSGLTARAASCACACSAPSGTLSCGSASIRTSSSASCIVVGTTAATLADGACTSVSLPSSGGWYLTDPPFSASGGAACTPTTANTVPPVTWDASHRGCGFGTPVACGSGVCAPPLGAGERLCVYVDGEAACPPAFPDRISTAEDVTDDRGCTACTCGGVTGTCGGRVDITNGCPGTILNARIDVGSCEAASTFGTGSANADYVPNGSCPPSVTTATGDATPTAVRTVCCATE